MKKYLVVILGFIFIPLMIAGQSDIVGLWKAIDDVDGEPSSHIEIYQEGGKVQARIVKLLNKAPDTLCEKCKGELKNKAIQGMTIMWDMTKSGKEWSGGRILDPKNGKDYKCKITLNKDGKSLDLRGYVGVPTLGRTQTWYRLD